MLGKHNIYRYVWRRTGRRQPLLIGLSLAIALLAAVPLELQRRIVNGAIEQKDLRLLVILGAALLAVYVVHSLIKHGMKVYRERVSAEVAEGARRRIHQHVRDEDGYDGGGTRISVLSQEVEGMAGFCGNAFTELIVSGGTALAMFGYMLVVQPTLALVAGAFFVPQMLLVPWFQRRVNAISEERIDIRRDMTAALEDRDAKRFGGVVGTLTDCSIRLAKTKSLGKIVVNFLSKLAPLSVLMFGGWLAIEGQTDLGTIVAFLSGFDRLAAPVNQLIAYYREASLTQTRHSKVAEWIEVPAA